VKTEEFGKPVLISGLIAGLLSSIPFVNFLNIICCLWILVGGVIAIYMLSSSAGRKIEYGEGALIGLLSGLVAAVVATIINSIFTLIGFNMGVVMMQRLAHRFPQFEQFKDFAIIPRFGAGFVIMTLLSSLLFYGAFGALGGVIGTAIYGKKKEAVKSA
jgi:hypothetical protein